MLRQKDKKKKKEDSSSCHQTSIAHEAPSAWVKHWLLGLLEPLFEAFSSLKGAPMIKASSLWHITLKLNFLKTLDSHNLQLSKEGFNNDVIIPFLRIGLGHGFIRSRSFWKLCPSVFLLGNYSQVLYLLCGRGRPEIISKGNFQKETGHVFTDPWNKDIHLCGFWNIQKWCHFIFDYLKP